MLSSHACKITALTLLSGACSSTAPPPAEPTGAPVALAEFPDRAELTYCQAAAADDAARYPGVDPKAMLTMCLGAHNDWQTGRDLLRPRVWLVEKGRLQYDAQAAGDCLAAMTVTNRDVVWRALQVTASTLSVISNPRQILDPTAPNVDHGVLLKVVTFSRDISCHFKAV